MMLDSNTLLDLELSCGKWSEENQKWILDLLKELHQHRNDLSLIDIFND